MQLDRDWVLRFSAILELLRRVVLITAVLLGAGVIAVVGNTIRLEILNRRAEIEVTKLVGGTNAFVRRPFLYAGVLYGILARCARLGRRGAGARRRWHPRRCGWPRAYGSGFTLAGPSLARTGHAAAGRHGAGLARRLDRRRPPAGRASSRARPEPLAPSAVSIVQQAYCPAPSKSLMYAIPLTD